MLEFTPPGSRCFYVFICLIVLSSRVFYVFFGLICRFFYFFVYSIEFRNLLIGSIKIRFFECLRPLFLKKVPKNETI